MASLSSASLNALSSLHLQHPKLLTSSASQNLLISNVAQNPFLSSQKTLKTSKNGHRIMPTKKQFKTTAFFFNGGNTQPPPAVSAVDAPTTADSRPCE